jgi:hypothetical protein
MHRGSEESNMTLYEYRLDTFSDTAHKGTTKIHRGNQVSALAAYWCPDKKRRFVIYQGAGNNDLYEYSVEDESRRLPLSSQTRTILTATSPSH